MRKPILTAMIIAAAAGSALAQSINVDIDGTTGSAGLGAPLQTFAGPATSIGFWNSSTAGVAGTIPVSILGGGVAGNQFTRSYPTGGATLFAFNNANTSGGFELLLDDCDSINLGFTATYTFSRLTPGIYEVYTAAIAPDTATFVTLVNVAGSAEGVQSVGGAMPVNTFAQGVTHAKHTVTVTGAGAGAGTIAITATPASTAGNYGTVSGIQIKLISASRVYVRTRTGTGDGLTWAGAFGTLTEALDYAATHTSVREIWVAEGTYKPTTRWITADPRSARFNLVNNVAVIGGFGGTELTLADRVNPALRPTILSGNIGSTSIATDNAYNVVYSNVASASLNGLQISDGYNILNECGATCFQAFGAGIRHVSGSLTIEQSLISNNYVATTELAGFGGGVSSVGNLRMSKCVVKNNTGRFGAGVSVGGDSRIFNCTFYQNSAMLSGGAIFSGNLNNLVANCVFAGNTAMDEPTIQGGAAISNGGQTRVSHCTFAGNGGNPNAYVITTNPFSPAGSTVTLVDSIIWGNPTPAIYGAATASRCDIEGGFAGLNISMNPRFWDAPGSDGVYGTLDDDYELRPFSPCIDAGTTNGSAADAFDYNGNGAINDLLPIDIGGNPRRWDDLGTVNSSGEIIDIGAYEFQYRSCPSDFNRDAVVDFFDYLDFVADFSALDASADYNADGVIDFFDYLDFVNAFSGGC